MLSEWKGMKTMTDVPTKRSNSGRAIVGGAEESFFHKIYTLSTAVLTYIIFSKK